MTRKKVITTIFIIVILLALVIVSMNTSNKTVVSNASDTEEKTKQTDYLKNVLDKDKITEINIDIKEADWKWLIENAMKKESRSCNVIVNGTTFYNVGVRPKGNSSLLNIAMDDTTDRFSLKLDFGEFMEGQTCFGLREISLNNMYTDKTYMKEYLAYGLFDYLGVPSPAYAYADIKINKKAWGLYLAVEVVGESFLERQFGTSKGNLYKPETSDIGVEGGLGVGGFGGDGVQGGFAGNSKGADLKYSGDSISNYSNIRDYAILKTTGDGDFEKVIEMIKNLNSGKNFEQYLDVNEILKYLAGNAFLVNLDSYNGAMYHNYFLYEKDGVFKVLPWDLNMAFAGFMMTEASQAINFPVDKPVTTDMESAPLIQKLLEVPEYKKLYHGYLKEITDKYIQNGIYENAINKVQELINGYVKTDVTAFFSYDDFNKSIPVLKSFGKERADSVNAQLNGKQPSTEYGKSPTTVSLSALGGMEAMGGGQGMPAMGGNAGGIPAVGAGNMPPMKNLQKIIAIMKDADGKALTEEQKQKLKELGMDDNMLSMAEKMSGKGGFPAIGNIGDMQGMGIPSGAPNINSIMQIGTLILSIAFLLAGLLFVFKFKRKKYITS